MINFPMALLFISLIITFSIAYFQGNGMTPERAFIAYSVAIGINLIFSGLSHIFVPEIVAKAIGWKPCSEFQHEIGIANIAFGILSLLNYFTKYSALYSIIATTIWFWGNAVGHILSYLKTKNSSSGNIGWALYFDIFMPIIYFLLYYNILHDKIIKLMF